MGSKRLYGILLSIKRQEYEVGLVGRVGRMVQQRGLMGTLRLIARRTVFGRSAEENRVPHPFDREHGVDTSGFIAGERLGAGHVHDTHMSAYVPMSPSRFHAAVRLWLATPPVGLAESHAFVDLGCGKGRVVLLGSKLHFREVVGVELNPELVRVARANLEGWKAERPVRVVCGDAAEFELPLERCLIYLANPFGAPVMRLLLERLEARVAAGGAGVDLLYQTPHQEAVFLEFPAFRLLWSVVPAVSDEDAAAETIYGRKDRCSLYRIG